MDGEWQICSMSPDDYGKKALQTAKIMKWVDPSIELVACGSCCTEISTYPDWDRIVLEHTYDHVDYLSLHRYYSYDPAHHLFYPTVEDRSDIAYFPIDLQDFLHTVISAADLVKTKKHSQKTMHISFDEWNVVSSSNPAFHPVVPWQSSNEEGEEVFSMLDVLVYGGLLCTFVKNADRVKIACQSLLVNAGGLFFTRKGGQLVLNPVYYPFQQVSQYGRGVSLLDRVICHQLQTNHRGEVPALQTAAVYNDHDGSVNVFVVNYDAEDDCQLSMDFRSFGNLQMIEHVIMAGDLDAINSVEEPERVKPGHLQTQNVDRGLVDIIIPKSSWNVLRFSTAPLE
jgi:alpha-N-arabinofuranosidase